MIGQRIDIAAAYLRGGEVVGIPTETVYGLAGNALYLPAVLKIFEVKDRPHFDPLIIHTDDISKLSGLVSWESVPTLRRIAEVQGPGPLTYLLPKTNRIDNLVTAGSDYVAVRIPSHPVTRELLSQLDFPVAAPSANPFGYISPTSASHVERQLGDKIPYILDGGSCEVGVESTIIGYHKGELVVYRKGGFPLENLYDYSHKIRINDLSTSNPETPGMLQSHYAPSCKVIIQEDWDLKDFDVDKIGILSLSEAVEGVDLSRQILLSPKGDLTIAAKNLFSGLRSLDELGVSIILTKLVPEEGLGRAINDRLRRAAG